MILTKLFTKNPLKVYGQNLLQINTKNLSFFSKRKGLEQNIKAKQIKQTKKGSQNNNSPHPSYQGLTELSKMKFLNIQFFPICLLLTPTLLSFEQMYDPTFLLGITLAEKYTSFSLLMNLDFKQNKTKTILILTAMTSLHLFTGYYSLVTPIGMALLTVFSPFKFSQDKDVYTESQAQTTKTMTNIKMAYFFFFILLATVKAMHYEAVFKLEKSLDKFNQENITQNPKPQLL